MLTLNDTNRKITLGDLAFFDINFGKLLADKTVRKLLNKLTNKVSNRLCFVNDVWKQAFIDKKQAMTLYNKYLKDEGDLATLTIVLHNINNTMKDACSYSSNALFTIL